VNHRVEHSDALRTSKKLISRLSRMTNEIFLGLVANAVAVIVSLVFSVKEITDLFRFSKAIIGGAVAVVLIVVFTSILTRLERAPSQVAKLKRELTSAYLRAIDGSSLNPNRSDGR